MKIKFLIISFLIALLKGEIDGSGNGPGNVENELVKVGKGLKKTCKDTDVLCTFIPSPSDCEFHEEASATFSIEVKRRCPLKCNTCPGIFSIQ
jgi:hypothetical protein